MCSLKILIHSCNILELDSTCIHVCSMNTAYAKQGRQGGVARWGGIHTCS